MTVLLSKKLLASTDNNRSERLELMASGMRSHSSRLLQKEHPMSIGSGEQELLNNKFGIISDKRVFFLSNKSLFSSGTKEEIPIQDVASVRFYRLKYFAAASAASFGLLLAFVIYVLYHGSLIAKISSLIVLVVGACVAYTSIAGLPTVVITTTGGKVTQASGWLNEKDEAKAFALVLREQLK